MVGLVVLQHDVGKSPILADDFAAPHRHVSPAQEYEANAVVPVLRIVGFANPRDKISTKRRLPCRAPDNSRLEVLRVPLSAALCVEKCKPERIDQE